MYTVGIKKYKLLSNGSSSTFSLVHSLVWTPVIATSLRISTRSLLPKKNNSLIFLSGLGLRAEGLSVKFMGLVQG